MGRMLQFLRAAAATVGVIAAVAVVGGNDAGPPPAPLPYAVPEVSTTELERQLASVCRRSVARDRPVLLEFSAPWCGDCRRLAAMKGRTPLRSELARWEPVTVNVGKGLHPELRRHFRVRAIARWVALKPTTCGDPVGRWPVLADRVVEPASGRDADAGALVAWLEDQRRPDPRTRAVSRADGAAPAAPSRQRSHRRW